MNREEALKHKRDHMRRLRADPVYREQERYRRNRRDRELRAIRNGAVVEGEVLVGWLHRPKCDAICACRAQPVYAEIPSAHRATALK